MILITGNEGFIGRHLTSIGQQEGYDLIHGLDIRDKYNLELAFEKCRPHTVVHLAALAGVRRSVLYPDDYISTNISGTWNVVKMCEKYKARLIFFSSSSVFGNVSPPTKETDAKKPVSLYGITKLAGEFALNTSSIQTTIIRPFTVYGEGGRRDQVIGKWVTQVKRNEPITIYGGLESCRGYTYVGDIADTVKKLVHSDWTWEHEDFNLGGVEIVTLMALVDIFKEVFPDVKFEYLERPAEDVASQFADISKARETLDYCPSQIFYDKTRFILKELQCS